MKVAAAVVVLISLLVLFDFAYSAPNCGENGVQDKYAKKYCSCFAGYAPSNGAQNDCNFEAKCPYLPAMDTATKIGGYQPTLYNTTFHADRYNVIIRLPIVEGRRSTTIRFNNGAPSCGYPGNLWYKSVSTLDCVDEFYGSMPWVSHDVCGWTNKVINGIRTTYSTAIAVSYDDLVSDPDEDYIRTTTIPLNVNVTFITQSAINLYLGKVVAGQTFVTLKVVGDAMYDANTASGTVTARTTASWPYNVIDVKMFSAPSPNVATISADINYDISNTCTNVTKSACYQQFVLRISPNGGCNIGGTYVFNITLGCRANVCGNAAYSSGSYSVVVFDTDVCGVGGIDISLSRGQILPFSDAAGNMPASSFQPNNMVYFAFTLTSYDATLDGATVAQLTATAGANGDVSDVLYDITGATNTYGMTDKGRTALLVITPASMPVPAGNPMTLWFSMKLSDAITSFRVLPSQTSTVTINIVVNLNFHSNNKRHTETIEATLATTSAQGMADIYLTGRDGASAGSEEAIVGDTSSSTSILPSSPFFLLFLTLVLMAALRF